MSLLRQLLLSVTVVILAILIGTLVFSVGSARQYLDTQLQAQSDSTATSLALTLSQASNQDPAIRELLISALFDSGQFSLVELLNPAGQVIVRREASTGEAAGVSAPGWFSELLPLEPHDAQRQVSDGWRQVGVVHLRANDGYARDVLWTSTLRVVLLTFTAGILWALCVLGLMRWLRRALHDEVMERVRALAEDRAPTPLQHRAMAELREVTHVIFDAHEQVRATTAERQARIESLELELNQDAVTGLANRKYFINELRRALEHSDEGVSAGGHVMLFRQRDLQLINQTMTRPIADQWLSNVGAMVTAVLQAQVGSGAWLARLNGSDFAFMLPLMPGPQAGRVAQAVRQILHGQRLNLSGNHFCRWAMALTDFEHAEDLGLVLGRLDEALMRAESSGQEDVEYRPIDAPHGGIQATSELGWRSLLRTALDSGGLELSVTRSDALGAERSEASLMLREPDAPELLSGYLFMPPATRLGLSGECDLRAVALGLRWLHRYPGELVIRVSRASLLQDDFLGRIADMLRADTDASTSLLLELDAFSVVADRELMVKLGDCLKQFGVRLGLRRFAEQPEALLHLHSLPIDYVKVSGQVFISQADNPGVRNLLKAIQETARELGVQVIMEGGVAPKNDK